ncbi:MAG: serine/threonine-protein kinase [Proteobacteria bacterium]|nr:serine/threonine-protein kinase [Pseudomonadota bacterium]
MTGRNADIGIDATVAPSAGTDAIRAPSAATDVTLASSAGGLDATVASGGVSHGAGGSFSPLPEIARSMYVVRGELARGGMGKIMVAEDTRLGRDVALKELLVADPSLVERFGREVRMTARLQHPGIVAVYEAGRWPSGEPFYAMRLVKGRSLEKVVEQRPRFEDRLGLVANLVHLCEAIAYAHDRGVIHRDLKPANVLVGDYGETVVIDWGLAKDLTDDGDEGDDVVPGVGASPGGGDNLTVVGAIVGTPAYMPPEQARGEVVDKRADVYALGALMWHVLAGKPPHGGTSIEEVLASVKDRALPSLGEVVPQAPPELVTIIARAMAKDPAARYPSARELAGELASFQAGKLIASHRYTAAQLVRRWVRRHRALVVALAALVLGGGLVAAVMVRQVVAERDRARVANTTAVEERDHARMANTAALQERGRLELVAGHPIRAAAYLAEAYRDGRDDASLRLMLGESMHAVDANVATIDLGVPIVDVVWVLGDTRIVAIADDGALALVDPAARSRTMLAPPAGGRSLRPLWIALSTDGTHLAVADRRLVRVFDLATRQALDLSTGGASPITTVALSPRGDLVAIGTYEDVRVFALATGTLVASTPGETVTVGFSGTTLRALLADTLVTFDAAWTATRLELERIAVDGRVCGDTVFLSRPQHDGGDGDPEIVQLRDGHARQVSNAALLDVACGTTRSLVGTDGDDPLVIVDGDETWSLGVAADRATLASIPFAQVDTRYLRATMDRGGTFAAATTTTGLVRVWEVASATLRASFDAHANAIHGLAFDATGGRLASGGDDGYVRIWTTGGWGGAAATTALPATRLTVRSADGRITARADLNTVIVTGAGEPVTFAVHEELITWVALSADGASLVAAARDGRIVMWDLATHAIVGDWQQPVAVTTGALVGQDVATGGRDGVVRVWTTASKVPRYQLAGHATEVRAIAWNPAGRSLLTSADTSVRLWRADGTLLRTFVAGGEAIKDAWWLADGQLVAADTDRAFAVWEVASGDLVIHAPNGQRPSVVGEVSSGARPDPADPRGVIRGARREVRMALARETRPPQVVDALVAARVPWHLVDGVALPTTRPLAIRTDETIAADSRLLTTFTYDALAINATPTRPRVSWAARPAATGDARAILDAAEALQRGTDLGAVRRALTALGPVTDAELRYALAWCRHWLDDDALAFTTILEAWEAWTDPATRDQVRADLLAFAAWSGSAPDGLLAKLNASGGADGGELRLAVAEAYRATGRVELATSVLADLTAAPIAIQVRGALLLADIAGARNDPSAVAGTLVRAAELASTLPAPDLALRPVTEVCGDFVVPTTIDGASLPFRVGRQVRFQAGAFFAIYQRTFDLRFALAARTLLELLAARYHLDASAIAACEQTLAAIPHRRDAHGYLDQITLRRAMVQQFAGVEDCYARALDRAPLTEGVVRIGFVTSLRGSLESIAAEPIPRTPAMTTLATCVSSVLARIALPRQLITNQLNVTYPLAFKRDPSPTHRVESRK